MKMCNAIQTLLNIEQQFFRPGLEREMQHKLTTQKPNHRISTTKEMRKTILYCFKVDLNTAQITRRPSRCAEPNIATLNS